MTLATTDPASKTVYVLRTLRPPMLDRVMLHEMAHVMTVSYGLLGGIRRIIPTGYWVPVEEWSAGVLERHSIEAIKAASTVLGRPVCIGGFCDD